MLTFHARDRAAWRAWLAAHHDAAPEVWLLFYKAHTGRPSVDLGHAVEEALCFGWIDSLVRRIDDDTYARKFTPRRARSRWSESNRRRYAALLAAGLLAPAGAAKAPPPVGAGGIGGVGDMGATGGPSSRPELEVPAPDLETAWRAHGAAWDNFSRLPPSHRRNYLRWIDQAKRPETRARRIAAAASLLAEGKTVGLK